MSRAIPVGAFLFRNVSFIRAARDRENDQNKSSVVSEEERGLCMVKKGGGWMAVRVLSKGLIIFEQSLIIRFFLFQLLFSSEVPFFVHRSRQWNEVSFGVVCLEKGDAMSVMIWGKKHLQSRLIDASDDIWRSLTAFALVRVECDLNVCVNVRFVSFFFFLEFCVRTIVVRRVEASCQYFYKLFFVTFFV